MCNFREREQAMVTIRPGVYCDPCLVPLIRALWDAGLPTKASCCGHGRYPGWVIFADGRILHLSDQRWRPVIERAVADHACPRCNGEGLVFVSPAGWAECETCKGAGYLFEEATDAV